MDQHLAQVALGGLQFALAQVRDLLGQVFRIQPVVADLAQLLRLLLGPGVEVGVVEASSAMLMKSLRVSPSMAVRSLGDEHARIQLYTKAAKVAINDLEVDMPEYRKKNGSDTWHWCRNCTNWPTSDYETSDQPPW
ncbi:MAG: hypothetical protein U5L06_11520 [Rhodovibrio sp.]|nr:hypothetical protein [Rhodovibrio sp.]